MAAHLPVTSCLQVSIVLSMVDASAGCDAGEILSLPQKYQSLIYYGDALYQLGEYKKAEVRPSPLCLGLSDR